MRSQRNFIAVSLFCLCFAFGQFLGAMPVLADSPPVLNEKTDPKILREYVKKTDELIRTKGPKAKFFGAKAQLLEWLKDNRGAVAEYTKALKLESDNYGFLVGRARSSKRVADDTNCNSNALLHKFIQ